MQCGGHAHKCQQNRILSSSKWPPTNSKAGRQAALEYQKDSHHSPNLLPDEAGLNFSLILLGSMNVLKTSWPCSPVHQKDSSSARMKLYNKGKDLEHLICVSDLSSSPTFFKNGRFHPKILKEILSLA